MSAGSVRMGGVFVEIGADPTKFFAAMNKANKAFASMGRTFSSAGKKMMGLGAGIAGPILVSAKAFADVGSALNDMSKRTGVATESLSVLKFAAEQTGTDMAGVETAVKKMQKAIFSAANGGKEAAKALEMVGLSASDLAGLSADEQMGKIADGLMAIQDPGTRAAVAMQIFGKAGTSILPMLEGGSAGMAAFAAEAKRLGLVMDSETAAKADSLGDAIDALQASMKMAFIQVGAAVAPILTDMAGALAGGAAAVGKLISNNQALVVSALKMGAGIAAAGGVLYGLGKAITFASSVFGGFLTAGSTVFSVLKTIASGALFVGMSFVKAIAGVVAFSASSVASAVASGTAWAAANAPLIILGGLLAAAGAAAFYAMGGFEGIGQAIGGGLNQAAADGMVVLGDLAATATTTFNGIYAAIAEGDLAGAMDILWLGLQAGWLRGSEALMNAVDPWISMFQNAFTIMGAEIYKTWAGLWVTVSNAFNMFGAYLQGAFDNIINSVLTQWDNLVAGIKKSWNWVQSWFRKGFDLKAENDKVDSEMAARKRERELLRPGIKGRTEKAAEENAQANQDLADRKKAIDQNTQDTIDQREAANAQRAGERRAATQAAEGAVNTAVGGAQEKRLDEQVAKSLIEELSRAKTIDELANVGASIGALIDRDAISGDTIDKVMSAYNEASARILGSASSAGAGVTGPANKTAEQNAQGGAAAIGEKSQAEVAGTFSSMALGGMGFGSSLAQKQVDLLGKIEENTREEAGAAA